jgi:CRISPR-associated protein Csm1
MFIVGAWDDCVELALDIQTAFARYAQGRLTISAGIGMYDAKFPIAVMARETGELEDAAKNLDEAKNKVALFADGGVFEWNILRERVIGEKLAAVAKFFAAGEGRGTAMIYKILEYLRGAGGRKDINIARLAYLLARLEPDTKDEEKRHRYGEATRKFYGWALEVESRREFAAALELYVYLNRNSKKGDD